MKVFLRACEAVYSQNGPRRPWNQSKAEIVQTCFISAFNAKHSYTVICDRVSDSTLDLFEQYGVEIKHSAPSNSNSCLMQHKLAYEYAINNPNDNVYLLEDDYLHTDNALDAMESFLNKVKNTLDGVVVNPMAMGQNSHSDDSCYKLADHPETFTPTHSTSMTYATSCLTFSQMYPEMLDGGYISSTNDYGWSMVAYSQHKDDPKKYKLFKSSPSLASHLHDYGLMQDRDWKSIFLKNKSFLTYERK